jgi:hypothetical protein
MRRGVLIVAAAIAAALASPNVSGAQVPTGDSVVGHGVAPCKGIKDFEVDAHSGPSGESPSGTHFYGDGFLGLNGPVTCLSVTGNRAVVGGQGTNPIDGSPIGLVAVIVDNGPVGPDTLQTEVTLTVPFICPAGLPGTAAPLSSGNFVVVDALVHPTSTSVSCSPSVFAPGGATVCSATVTDTASSRQSTPTGTVSFSNSALGGQAITASYGGHAMHSASLGRTVVAVVLPASTNRCLVFGRGRITAANGDQASFRGLAVAAPPRGAEFYRDNRPANAFRLASTSVGAVTCSQDASRASVFGKAKLNGMGSVEYRIDIQLAAWERGRDTYPIRLSSGYASGAQPIRHGDLDIHVRGRDHRQ